MANNWIELNLTKDEEALVRRGAELYKAIYLDTIDNIFVIARAVETLRNRHYGSGVQGGFGDALVQYGFTTRDGETPMDKGIRSNLKELLESEHQVRDWWKKVDGRKKRDWLSARAIYRHWKASTKVVDPNAPKLPTPLQRERATSKELKEQLDKVLAENRALRTDDGGNQFNLDDTGAEVIGRVISDHWRASPSRIETLIRTLQAELKELRGRIKAARPKGTKAARRKEVATRLRWNLVVSEFNSSFPGYYAQTGDDTSYSISAAFAFGSDKFTGYMVRHGKGVMDERRLIGNNVRSPDEAKALAERDYARWCDEEGA